MDRDVMLHFQEIPDLPIRYDCFVSTEMNLVLYRSYEVTVNHEESGNHLDFWMAKHFMLRK